MHIFIYWITTLTIHALMITNYTCALREPIKPFTNRIDNNLTKYHIAQIVPPGKYKVVIWDKLIKRNSFFNRSSRADTGTNSSSSRSPNSILDSRWSEPDQRKYVLAYDQNNFRDYAQYFAHFYAVETDAEGQFLVEKNGRVADWSLFNRHYNVNITPMKGTSLIPSDRRRRTVWQRVFSRGIKTPIDSVCHFGTDRRCLIFYFESYYEWLSYTKTTLDTLWLGEPCTGAMQDRANFFLIASFRHVLTEAKKCYEMGRPMERHNAHILGIYWNYFARANKHGNLMDRIRLIDDKILRLINEFCQIDTAFLLSHYEIAYELFDRNGNDYDAFCPAWSIAYEKLSRFNQPTIVMDEFYNWLYSTDGPPLDNESREVIQFWLGMFSKWLNEYVTITPWLELDLSLYNQIGQLFAGVKAAQLLTLDKIQLIPGVENTLDAICVGTFRSAIDFLTSNGYHCYPIIDQWRVKLCSSRKFKYSSPQRMITTPNMSPTNSSSPPGTMTTPNLSPITNSVSPRFVSINIVKNEGKQSVDSANLCVICMTNERHYAFSPCYHLCGCEECSDKVLSAQNPYCPICRVHTDGKVRIYQP